MKKSERHEYITRTARELANTGDFGGWLEIEHHLRWHLGQPEARTVLDDRYTRDELDRACERAKEAKNA